ncbi:MAG TPA: AI-2E family transporter, partial [Bacteroidota bacterium]|nr:AI-2E family transporter [Bacteroidota bacterium]
MPRTKKQPDKRTELARFVEVNKIEALIIAAGIILLLFLIYTIQIVISPFIVLGAILFLLYPLRSHVVARNIMWLAGVLFLFWFLYSIVGILAPFVVSLLLAYILHPLITKAETWGIPRWASSLFTIFCGIAVITVVALLVLPIAFRQFTGILEAVSTIANDFTNWIVSDRAVASLHQYGISTQQVRDMLTNTFAPRLEIIMKGLLEGAFGLVSGLSTVVSRIVNMVIIPFLTFYVLKDFPLIRHRAKMLFPRSKRDRVGEYYAHIDELLGRYIRGAITVAAINAVLVTLFFSVFGIQYPLVLGIVAGVLDLIPYFGLIIMLILSVIVASFSPSAVAGHMILAASTIGALHIFEAAVLSPKIIGSKV